MGLGCLCEWRSGYWSEGTIWDMMRGLRYSIDGGFLGIDVL